MVFSDLSARISTAVFAASLLCIPLSLSAATHHVTLSGITFDPKKLTIQQGDDVVWDSGLLSSPNTFSRTFDVAGKYDYYCMPHGSFGMTATITVEPDVTGIPDAAAPGYSLGQNYPNPFNPVTTIEYSIERSAHVTLEIFNARSQRVRTLEDEVKAAGSHAAFFDGKDLRGDALASGIYFYQLKLGGMAVEMRKMVLIK